MAITTKALKLAGTAAAAGMLMLFTAGADAQTKKSDRGNLRRIGQR